MRFMGLLFSLIVTSLIMNYLRNHINKQPAINNNGIIVLKYHKSYAIIGYIGILFFSMLAIAAILAIRPIRELIMIIGMILVLLGPCVFVVVSSRKMKVELYEYKIE